MAHLTTKQVKQLCEIDNAGPGIRVEVQELIQRLTSGGVGPQSDDPRFVQAKRLWDKGFGREQKMSSFEEYLATIPEVPEDLEAHDDRFPLLALVDARLGLVMTCVLLGVGFAGDDGTFEDFDPKKARTEKVYWIRAQDGKKNRGKSVRTCRSEFVKDEFGLTAHEGLALFAQNPEIFWYWSMDLTDSVDRESRDRSACLEEFSGRYRYRLGWDWNGHEHPDYGSVSRRE